jgi:gamma-glutamyl-gamma-aminobutyrate hydrolase PuuD
VKAGSRPTIGVTAATERVSYGVWNEIPAVISPARYLQAVQRAGGRPVLLSPDPEDAEDPGEVLDLLDVDVGSSNCSLRRWLCGRQLGERLRSQSST